MNTAKLGVVIILILILGTIGVVYAVTTGLLTIPTSGVVADSTLTVTPASIDWGTIYQSQTFTRTLNITNHSNQPTLPLNLTAPGFAQIGAVTWNIETLNLPAGSSINATITLNVYPNATKAPFQIPIYING